MTPKLILRAAAFALALVGCALGQGQGAAPKSPKLVIASTEHNFGEVKAGEVLTHSFVVKNEGTADLEIKNVVPG